MKLVITTSDLSELHFEGESKEIFESAKRYFIKIFPEEFDIPKPFTIQDLANGKCAVENNGTPEQLRVVLKVAFPKDDAVPTGRGKFYFKYGDRYWADSDITNIPTQSVADFLEPEFVWGEEVEVEYKEGEWAKMLFIAKSLTGNEFICERLDGYFDKYKTIRKLPTKTKLTMQEIAYKFGVEVDNLEIV